MADHGELEYATATGNDYASHEQTYVSFIKMVKMGIAAVVIILILMAYFLT
jgi:Bacterial aa3 type cytochrome c oxidase subunit IV